MKPPCYNRPPFRPDFWMQDGWNGDGTRKMIVVPTVFEDRCATHDGAGIGPNNENYPAAHGFDCEGCRWFPGEKK